MTKAAIAMTFFAVIIWLGEPDMYFLVAAISVVVVGIAVQLEEMHRDVEDNQDMIIGIDQRTDNVKQI